MAEATVTNDRLLVVVPPAFLNDQPVDKESADKLEYSQYATALFSLIDLGIAETPCSIAVSGPWGSGKTSLARLLEGRLRGHPTPVKPHVTCWFNAWMHSSADDVRSPLIAIVSRSAARARSGLWRLLRPLPSVLCQPWVRRVRFVVGAVLAVAVTLVVARVLGGFNKKALTELNTGPSWLIYPVAGLSLVTLVVNALTPVVSGVARYVKSPSEAAFSADMDRASRQLGNLIRRALGGKRKFVLFIDDLDRCSPEQALLICSLAVQLLAHPGVVIVLLGDLSMLERYTAKKLMQEGMTAAEAAEHSREFLDKIIQLRIALPEPSADQLDRFTAPTPPPPPRPLPVIGSVVVSMLLQVAVMAAALTGAILLGFLLEGVVTAELVTPTVGAIAFAAIRWFSAGAVKQQEQVSQKVDRAIRMAIAAGIRRAPEIVSRVRKACPEADTHRLSSWSDWLWLVVMSPVRFKGFDDDYLTSRAHALLAQRWAAAVSGTNTEEQAWSPALAEANRTIARDLPRNPRRRKRVLNNVFVYFMLADMRGVMDTTTRRRARRREHGLPPAVVAKWALFVAEWPDVATAAVQHGVKDDFAGSISIVERSELDLARADVASAKRFLEQEPTLDEHLGVLATMSLRPAGQ